MSAVERTAESTAGDSPVHRYLLPGMGARNRDARTVRPVRHGARVPAPVRLTTRGKCVVVLAWITVAYVLAWLLPFWWLRF